MTTTTIVLCSSVSIDHQCPGFPLPLAQKSNHTALIPPIIRWDGHSFEMALRVNHACLPQGPLVIISNFPGKPTRIGRQRACMQASISVAPPIASQTVARDCHPTHKHKSEATERTTEPQAAAMINSVGSVSVGMAHADDQCGAS